MMMGRRKSDWQEAFFVTADALPKSPGHPFYRALNWLLAEAGIDCWGEERGRSFQVGSPRGQPSLSPGGYFRMLFVGYYEGIGSQRGIAGRCVDSASLRAFLTLALDQRGFAAMNTGGMDLFQLQALMRDKSLGTTRKNVNIANRLNRAVDGLFVPDVTPRSEEVG